MLMELKENDVRIEKNPVVKLKLISETNNARTGDVIDYNAIAYDKRGNVIENIKANILSLVNHL